MLKTKPYKIHRTTLPKGKEADYFEILQGINVNQLKAQECRLSFFAFVQNFWEEAGIHETPVWNWHIPVLCEELEKLAYRVAAEQDNEYDLDINIPPGTTKSLLFTVFFPAWCWTKWPWLKFIKLSYSATLSLEHAETCREILRSEKYQVYFPETKIKRDKDQKSNFRLQYWDAKRELWRLGGALFSTSIRGTVTGMHSHFILIDDPLDPFKSFSLAEIESANKWIKNVLPTRKINKAVTPTIMIMQRTHPNDPSGQNIQLKKKGLRLKRIVLPGYLSDDSKRRLVKPKRLLEYYDKNGGFLDPIRLNIRVLDELELKLGQYGYKAQVDQDPSSPSGMLFNTESFSNYLDLTTYNDAADFLRSIRYWDKAGTTDGGKYTAGVKMAELRPVGGNPRYLVQDVVRGRWAAERREAIIEQTALQDGPDVVQWVEQEPGSGGKESAENTIKRLRKRGIACLAERPVGDKFYRADPFSVAWNRGQVLLLRGPWNNPFLDELANFSSNSEFKDQVDAAGAAYSKLNGTRGGTW
jgi:predicted phage terminase large subunit-like protein